MICSPAFADAWPDNTIGGGFGVAAKPERTDAHMLKRISASGFSYVRYDMRWSEVEIRKGSYYWNEFDYFIGNMRKAHLKSVIILHGSNLFYSQKVSVPPDLAFGETTAFAAPTSSEAMDAFTAFAVEAVKRYGTDDILWEIWNEPDFLAFWPPTPDPVAFSKLASQTCTAIRNAAPKAKIIGPAIARFPSRIDLRHREFFSTFMQSSAAHCIDAISVHPYRSEKNPETVIDDYNHKLRPFMEEYLGNNILPIMNTEWGYSLTEADAAKQAQYALRIRLSDVLANVPLSILYEWQDSASMSEEREAHFGMIDDDDDDKEGNKLLSRLMPEIKDSSFVRRIAISDPDCYAALLRRSDGSYQMLAWLDTDDQAHRWTLKIKDNGKDATQLVLSSEPQLIAINSPEVAVTITKTLAGPPT